MTASMFDLSMKDKTRSPFAKLKDKMKGRKNDGTFSDTSSAIVPSTHMPDASTEFPSSEIQMKSKPKKPFLLGPQRLSSAHSMSDLTGSHLSSEKLKSSAVGPTHLLSRQIDSFGVVPESGKWHSFLYPPCILCICVYVIGDSEMNPNLLSWPGFFFFFLVISPFQKLVAGLGW